MNGVSLGGVSAQLMMAMDELSRGVRAQQRERAEHEASEALRQGLEEAQELRNKADDELTGAIVGGAITGVSGTAQFCAGLSLSVSGAGATAEKVQQVQVDNGRATALGQSASTLGSIGKFTQDSYAAAGASHEARAREAGGRAQAASRRADAAQSEAQEARRSGDKARDLQQQLMELEHASRMAVLRG
jgi:hypothetical protein